MSKDSINERLRQMENRFPSRMKRQTDQVVALDEKLGFKQVESSVPLVNDRIYRDFTTRRSVWPFLGDQIALKFHLPICFINIGEFGSSIGEWVQKNNPLINRFILARGVNLNAILWHQGESDGLLGTSGETYRLQLKKLIQDSRKILNANVPWLVAIASGCGTQINSKRQAISDAQHKVIEEEEGVFMGPRADEIEHDWHFNKDWELQNLVSAWMNALERSNIINA